MDPVTAIFNFLSTPAGQAIANQIIALDATFVGLIKDLITNVHAKVTAEQPTPPAKTA